MSEGTRPLEGLRVVELGQLLAGPFTGTILAYFGAEVIKVEPPGGDPIRGWREVKGGTSLWYRSLGRNKKSVTLDLKSERGRALAIIQRQRSGEGQTIDVALYESVFNLLEAVVPEFDGAGLVREPSGTTLTGIVPTNTYRCADGRHVIIGGNGDSIFKRLMVVAGRPDMAEDPALAHNAGRVQQEAAIDAALAEWCAGLTSAAVIAQLEAARVPVGPIYSVADMVADPHFQARGLFETV